MAKSMRKSCKKGGMKKYGKGSKSKTMKGKKDFTTKKTSKVFNRRGHYQKHAKGSRKVRAPYQKGGIMSIDNLNLRANHQGQHTNLSTKQYGLYTNL